MKLKFKPFILALLAFFTFSAGWIISAHTQPTIAATQIMNSPDTTSMSPTNPAPANAEFWQSFCAGPGGSQNLICNAMGAANGAKTVYELTTKVSSLLNMDIREWVGDVFWGGVVVEPLSFVCGGEYDDADLLAGKDCAVTDNVLLEASLRDSGRLPGGLASALSLSTGTIVDQAPIPNDMAYFWNDMTNDTLFGTNAYAATGGYFDAGVFELWKTFRNIALSLLGVFLAVVAIMIMFRKKVSAQSVVTIYSVLPYIPISILLIIFSYPIITIALNSLEPIMRFAYSLSKSLFNSMTTLTVADSSTGMAELISGSINNFIKIVLAVISGKSLALILFGVIALVMTILLLLAFTFQYIKVYVNFMIFTLAMPFVALFFILPGKQGLLVNLLKRVLVDILLIPAMLIVFVFGLAFIGSGVFVPNSLPIAIGNILGFGIFLVFAKTAIGLGIMWKAVTLRGSLMNLVGAEGSIFGAGAAPAAGKRK